MKKIALISFCLSLFICCNKSSKDGNKLTATTAGFPSGTSVFLNQINASNRPTVIDSATIQDGKFSLSLPKWDVVDFSYLTFSNTRGNVLFLSENAPIEMTIYKDSLDLSKIKGGKLNQLFTAYQQEIQELNKERAKLLDGNQFNRDTQDIEVLRAVQMAQDKILEKELSIGKKYAEQHSNSILSLIALTDLLQTDLMPIDRVKNLYQKLKPELQNSRLGKNINTLLKSKLAARVPESIKIGKEAKDFKAPNPEGQMLSLKESLGKVTIVDFWASWCKPCRLENPNVVKVYKKFHKKGLNIVGVSLDKKKQAWKKAIQEDRLTWKHVSNLKFWHDPIAQQYGVRAIPTTFILDEKGVVIAKNLRGIALEKKISELLEAKAL